MAESSASSLNRRQFLGSSARQAASMAAGVAAGVVPWGEEAVASPLPGPVTVGVIGVRQQGGQIARALARLPGVQVAALCDVDSTQLPGLAQEVAGLQAGVLPRTHVDFRQLLADPTLQAVAIATPDHWHALLAAHALRAGKDVYLETPVTHSLDEGDQLLRLARETGRIVQGALVQRSGPHFAQAIEFLRQGHLGRVHQARAWTVHQRKGIGRGTEGAVPAGLDYDLWLGPAPARPFQANRLHANWRWFWDYGSGELGNWGVQMLDLARWGLGVGLPLQVSASGGKFHFNDDQQTPDTLQVQYQYPQQTITWEHRLWSPHAPEGRSAAVAFEGERGTLLVDRGGWKVQGGVAGVGQPTGDLLALHLGAFVESVRTRGTPVVSLEDCVTSSVLCHLGCLAYRLGRSVNVDLQTGRPRNDPSAERLLTSPYRAPWQWPA